MKKAISTEPTPENIAQVLDLLADMPVRLEGLVHDLTDAELCQSPGHGQRSYAETMAHLVHCEDRSSYLALLVNEPLMPEVHPERQWGKLLRYDLLGVSDLLIYFKLRRAILLRVLRTLNAAQWRRVIRETGKKRKESVYWQTRSLALHELEHLADLEHKLAIRPPGFKELSVDNKTRKYLDNLRSDDRALQNEAYMSLLKATEKPVDWAYEVWDSLVEGLRHKDNHVRAISAQILANLAKSDSKNRMKRDFPALLAVTRDKKFVTARHTLQSIWKVGAQKKTQRTVVDALTEWFTDCKTEKNWSLIRYDIIQALRNLYDEVQDEKIKQTALKLIEAEEDLKYRKKYAGVWK